MIFCEFALLVEEDSVFWWEVFVDVEGLRKLGFVEFLVFVTDAAKGEVARMDGWMDSLF